MLYQIFFIKIKILSLGITKQKENKISRAHVVSTIQNIVPWKIPRFLKLGSKKDLFCEAIPLTESRKQS